MNKYLSIFRISFAQETAYRVNFILWRMRNLFQIFLLFFLWDSVFSDPGKVLFGYDRAKILTYIFGIIALKAVVSSVRATEVAGEIARGDLSKFLSKPISYIKYWFVRDLSVKLINVFFAVFEVAVLFYILKPPLYLQTSTTLLVAFFASLILAILIFFYLLMLSATVAFWVPEAIWPAQYIVIAILAELFSGAIFPIDILPRIYQHILYFTPFPYLLFFPLQVYLGKLNSGFILRGLGISVLWVLLLFIGLDLVWKKGLHSYRAEGG